MRGYNICTIVLHSDISSCTFVVASKYCDQRMFNCFHPTSYNYTKIVYFHAILGGFREPREAVSSPCTPVRG
jgi:hypothetical protein